MKHDNEKYSAYTNSSHMVRKTRQVVMLYEGAIKSIQHAKEAIINNDVEKRYNSLARACDIINGLQLSLDFNKGGEIAQLLHDYYAGIDSRLSSVHFSKDTDLCDMCIEHLKMMKEAWEEVDHSESGIKSANDKENKITGDEPADSHTDHTSKITDTLSNIATGTFSPVPSVSLNC